MENTLIRFVTPDTQRRDKALAMVQRDVSCTHSALDEDRNSERHGENEYQSINQSINHFIVKKLGWNVTLMMMIIISCVPATCKLTKARIIFPYLCLSVCLSVSLSTHKLKHCWSESDVI